MIAADVSSRFSASRLACLSRSVLLSRTALLSPRGDAVPRAPWVVVRVAVTTDVSGSLRGLQMCVSAAPEADEDVDRYVTARSAPAGRARPGRMTVDRSLATAVFWCFYALLRFHLRSEALLMELRTTLGCGTYLLGRPCSNQNVERITIIYHI